MSIEYKQRSGAMLRLNQAACSCFVISSRCVSFCVPTTLLNFLVAASVPIHIIRFVSFRSMFCEAYDRKALSSSRRVLIKSKNRHVTLRKQYLDKTLRVTQCMRICKLPWAIHQTCKSLNVQIINQTPRCSLMSCIIEPIS